MPVGPEYAEAQAYWEAHQKQFPDPTFDDFLSALVFEADRLEDKRTDIERQLRDLSAKARVKL